MSCEHTSVTQFGHMPGTANTNRSHRYNPAAHTPCVLNTPIVYAHPCCGWLCSSESFCKLLLCVIQHCHCSTCAKHSASTITAAGEAYSAHVADPRGTLSSQWCVLLSSRHWPTNVSARCLSHFMYMEQNLHIYAGKYNWISYLKRWER